MTEEQNIPANLQFLWSKEEYLRKRYPWAESYIYYYMNVAYVDWKEIPEVLDGVSEADRSRTDFEYMYAIFREYRKKKLNLAVVIPTYNRSEEIKFLLEYAAPIYRIYGIDIIIYDSSTDGRTCKYTNEIRESGYFNVIYKRYNGVFDGFSLDHKIINAYNEFSDEYDYIWLCRDGLIPVIVEIIDKLIYYKKRGVDCIIVDTTSRTENLEIEKVYRSAEDAESLLLEQASRLQTLGMLIVSSSFAKKMIETVPVDDSTYSLWQMAAPFHMFARKPYEIVFFTKKIFAANIKAKAAHFWGEKTLEQWARRWTMVIQGMPSCYDTVKKQCMMVYTVDFHPFCARNILEMRAGGGLDRRIERKYEKYLPDVTFTPVWFFRFVSAVPKWVAKAFLKIADSHLDTVKRIRKRLIFDKRD